MTKITRIFLYSKENRGLYIGILYVYHSDHCARPCHFVVARAEGLIKESSVFIRLDQALISYIFRYIFGEGQQYFFLFRNSGLIHLKVILPCHIHETMICIKHQWLAEMNLLSIFMRSVRDYWHDIDNIVQMFKLYAFAVGQSILIDNSVWSETDHLMKTLRMVNKLNMFKKSQKCK